MPAFNLLLADTNFISAPDVLSGLKEFVRDRNLVWDFVASRWSHLVGFVASQWSHLLDWLSQPGTLSDEDTLSMGRRSVESDLNQHQTCSYSSRYGG